MVEIVGAELPHPVFGCLYRGWGVCEFGREVGGVELFAVIVAVVRAWEVGEAGSGGGSGEWPVEVGEGVFFLSQGE